MTANSSKMLVDHISNLSASKKSIDFLSMPLFDISSSSEVMIRDDPLHATQMWARSSATDRSMGVVRCWFRSQVVRGRSCSAESLPGRACRDSHRQRLAALSGVKVLTAKISKFSLSVCMFQVEGSTQHTGEDEVELETEVFSSGLFPARRARSNTPPFRQRRPLPLSTHFAMTNGA